MIAVFNSILIFQMLAILALLAVYALADAIQDVITWHYDSSIFKDSKHRQYLDPQVSWRNKYRRGIPEYGPKFFGSTTFLVWVTDLWHLCKFIKMNSIWAIAAVCSGCWWLWLAGIILHGALFEIFYNLLKKKI